ncbi:MAG TPA: methyltransferase domain-containing protein [Candidatus Eisenbacteria bacterium]|nr:methyltransferase domain-containing protein [Candidatus Eisenbacteria bacterium]
MSLVYQVMYLVGFKPWDSGVPPRELRAVVEGPAALAPGRALDLGCGTGTNAVYLARNGWEVTAIDVVGRPLRAARRKAEAAGVTPRFIRGDVTRLSELGAGDGYGLVFDLGCFHGVPAGRRDAYAAGVTAAAAPGATFLLFGFAPEAMARVPGVSADELRRRLPGWELDEATRGTDRLETWWYRLHRV